MTEHPVTEHPAATDDLANVFATISQLLLSQETVASALRLVASLIQETIPGTTGAGVSLLNDSGRRTTAAATDPIVEAADSLQYELDEGPCLTAWAQRTGVRVDDTATDQRFARWGDAASALGLRSTLSTPLIVGDAVLGAIKAYADQPAVFDSRSEHLIQLFAGPAAVLLANVLAQETAQRLTQQLQDALRTRDAIATATGILMARKGIGSDDAFALLVATARRQELTLQAVAREIVSAPQLR